MPHSVFHRHSREEEREEECLAMKRSLTDHLGNSSLNSSWVSRTRSAGQGAPFAHQPCSWCPASVGLPNMRLSIFLRFVDLGTLSDGFVLEEIISEA